MLLENRVSEGVPVLCKHIFGFLDPPPPRPNTSAYLIYEWSLKGSDTFVTVHQLIQFIWVMLSEVLTYFYEKRKVYKMGKHLN